MFVIIHAITTNKIILQLEQQWYLSTHAWDFVSAYALLAASEEIEGLILLINQPNLLSFTMLILLPPNKKPKSKKYLSQLKTLHPQFLLSLRTTLQVLLFLLIKDINIRIKCTDSPSITMELLLSLATILLNSTNILRVNLNINNKYLFSNHSTIINMMTELNNFESK